MIVRECQVKCVNELHAEFKGISYHVNNSALMFCIGESSLNSFFKTSKAIRTENKDILYSTVLKAV